MTHFLVEIHTEELPPKALPKLARAFLQEIEERLRKVELSFDATQLFATPRRLAVIVKNLAERQADTLVERKGPALQAAFDKDNNPTPACLGFARSCHTTVDQLLTIKNATGTWVGFQQAVLGKSVGELLPTIIQQALDALPIPKRMRWGNQTIEFVRPVHSVILLYGKQVIDAEILGCQTGRKTRGHRFMSSGWLDINQPDDYSAQLKEAFVIADFNERKSVIRAAAIAKNSQVYINDALLDEVTGLVEWPVAIEGNFDEIFLAIPQEALISAMQDHQRYFPIVDPNGKLCSQFITIINIESKDPEQVIQGNERVLRARLADAAFFFETDKKVTLDNRIEKLKQIIFQAKLGTLYDKAQRLSHLTLAIANLIAADQQAAARAGFLAKADLTTALVGEFPELQGIAGGYYALADGEERQVATALSEHYLPRFSNDALPASTLGAALAIADRLDTLVGLFGTNQPPTGDKDPFGLRRAAIGVLRILIEKKFNLDLKALIESALSAYTIPLENKNVVSDVLNFMLERLKPFYQDQGIAPDVLAAVTALSISEPYDLHCRIQAVQRFKSMPESNALSVANKRVSNMLAKLTTPIYLHTVDKTLFEMEEERALFTALTAQQKMLTSLSDSTQYQVILAELAHLREPVDNFFDKVLIMTEDLPRRENRLLMLKELRELFLHVADIALLQ